MAGRSATANLAVSLSARTRRFHKRMAKARREIASLAGTVAKFAVGGGAVVAAAGAGLGYMAKRTADNIDAQSKMARNLRQTNKEFQSFQLRAAKAGLSTEEANKSLAKMNRTISDAVVKGTAESVEMFDELGLSLADLEKQSTTEKFITIQKALSDQMKAATEGLRGQSLEIARHREATRQDAITSAIFGRQWEKMADLLSGDAERGLRGTERAMARLGLTMSQSMSKNVEKANDQITDLSFKMGEFWKLLVASVWPAVGGMGEAFGQWLEEMIRAEGGARKLALSIGIAFLEGVSVAIDMIAALGRGLLEAGHFMLKLIPYFELFFLAAMLGATALSRGLIASLDWFSSSRSGETLQFWSDFAAGIGFVLKAIFRALKALGQLGAGIAAIVSRVASGDLQGALDIMARLPADTLKMAINGSVSPTSGQGDDSREDIKKQVSLQEEMVTLMRNGQAVLN